MSFRSVGKESPLLHLNWGGRKKYNFYECNSKARFYLYKGSLGKTSAREEWDGVSYQRDSIGGV